MNIINKLSMIDLGNKQLNEQKMVPLVARFKKYLSFI